MSKKKNTKKIMKKLRNIGKSIETMPGNYILCIAFLDIYNGACNLCKHGIFNEKKLEKIKEEEYYMMAIDGASEYYFSTDICENKDKENYE